MSMQNQARFAEPKDYYGPTCKNCERAINEDNSRESFEEWERNPIGFENPKYGWTLAPHSRSWYKRDVTGCQACRLESAIESAQAFLKNNDAEDAMTILADALGIPYGAGVCARRHVA